MKITIFLLVILAGAIIAEDCVQLARDNCAEAFENYDPSRQITYCNHVRKVENCLKTVHERCYNHYWHTYEDICGPHLA